MKFKDKGVNFGGNGYQETPDNGGFLWGLLGCCVPIAGLVLFLVWKDVKPKTAKAVGIGALVSVCIGVLYYVLIATLGFTMFSFMNLAMI